MTLDAHAIVTALLGMVCAVLGWLARELWSAVKKLREDLDTLRVHLAEDYPSYDRLTETLKPIAVQLDRIEGALTNKVDK
jgi:hypothetical protein